VSEQDQRPVGGTVLVEPLGQYRGTFLASAARTRPGRRDHRHVDTGVGECDVERAGLLCAEVTTAEFAAESVQEDHEVAVGRHVPFLLGFVPREIEPSRRRVRPVDLQTAVEQCRRRGAPGGYTSVARDCPPCHRGHPAQHVPPAECLPVAPWFSPRRVELSTHWWSSSVQRRAGRKTFG
jgi:hypothetical protein